jgi:hypothetical protein
VAVKVDHADGPISLDHGAQQRQRDRVVPAQGDNARERTALAFPGAVDLVVARGPREAVLEVGVRLGRAREHGVVAALDLLDGVGVVVAGDGDVAAVDDGGPAGEGVGLERDVVTAWFFLFGLVEPIAARSLPLAGSALSGERGGAY